MCIRYSLTGAKGTLALRRFDGSHPRYIAVLVHGYAEHSGRYTHVAERLVRHGAVVYAYDHQGHGESAGERALVTTTDLVADLDAVASEARHNYPTLPVVILGHSMGGVVATLYAQLYPDALSAIVLSGPVIGGNPAFTMLLTMEKLPNIPIDPSELSRDEEVSRDYLSDPLVWHGPFMRETLQAMVESVEMIALGPKLGALPVLWLHGEKDTLAPLEVTREVLDTLKGDHLVSHIYPGAMHEVLNETNRAQVFDDLIEFLDTVVGRMPPHRIGDPG